jgi:protein-tyrosine-phosphatase
MGELGIDISRQKFKLMNEFPQQNLDYILTVCDEVQVSSPFFLKMWWESTGA